jgi:hypothetical protein
LDFGAAGVEVRVHNAPREPLAAPPRALTPEGVRIAADGSNATLDAMLAAGMRAPQRAWTEEEDAAIRRYTGKLTAAVIASVINRTTTAVQIRMKRLGVGVLGRRGVTVRR